jgi:hypothetical protein
MSRTYRTGVQWVYHVRGEFYTNDDEWRRWGWRMGWKLIERWTNKCRDGKRNNGLLCSPPMPWAKRIQARYERRHQNWAVRDGKDMPFFKKTVRWDYW